MAANQSGFSSIEALVMTVMFTLMVGFTLGVFGIIHTGILHSIGSRNYAFEAFRHRANLSYLRDGSYLGEAANPPSTFDSYVEGTNSSSPPLNFRLLFVTSETTTATDAMYPSERPISKGRVLEAVNRNSQFHSNIINEANLAAGKRYDNLDGVNPVWITVAYGICMNASCQ